MARRIALVLIGVAAILRVTRAAAEEPVFKQESLRKAVEKALPLLMKGAVGHRENRTCFACHNQGPPLMALAAAKAKGFKIDEEEMGRQLAFITEFLGKNRENYLQGKGTG